MTDELIKGLLSFKRYHYDSDGGMMSDLVVEGQDPRYFIISCIDSRCNPGTIFRAKPGTFFAHKAMGAIVRPYKQGTALAAALQFAINYNNVEKIIVLGHTKCGAVKALVENVDDPEISSFITVAQHGLERAKEIHGKACSHDDLHRHAEEQIVLESTENLKEYPSVAQALKEGKIEVKSWIFDLEHGDLLEHDQQSNQFKLISNIEKTEDCRQHA